MDSIIAWLDTDNPRMQEALLERRARRRVAAGSNIQQSEVVEPVQQSEILQMPQEASYRCPLLISC